MSDRLNMTLERYHRVAAAALVLLTVIVFSGAGVRITGSGLGCPDWPRCYEDGPVYAELDTHAMIEFGNRLFSGIVSIGALAAGVLVFFLRPRRRDLEVLGVMLPLGVVAQAVLGGLTVKSDLRPGYVMGHFGLSLVVLVAAWALYWRSKPGYETGAIEPGARDRLTMWAARLLLPLGTLVVFAGTAATAAGPHAGGRGTGDLVKRLYIRGRDTLDWVVERHGTVAVILGLATIAAFVIAWARDASGRLLLAIGTVGGLLALQGGLGIVQYSLELPTGLVWVHVVTATCTWLALLWVWSVAGTPERAPAGEPSATPSGARA